MGRGGCQTVRVPRYEKFSGWGSSGLKKAQGSVKRSDSHTKICFHHSDVFVCGHANHTFSVLL